MITSFIRWSNWALCTGSDGRIDRQMHTGRIFAAFFGGNRIRFCPKYESWNGQKTKKSKKIEKKFKIKNSEFSVCWECFAGGGQIFSKLFSKKRLTFFNFRLILCGLSSWEQIKKDSQPLKFCGYRNNRMNRVPDKLANIVNKSSSSRFLMQIKNRSRRDMQTVEFGNIQTLTKSMCIS